MCIYIKQVTCITIPTVHSPIRHYITHLIICIMSVQLVTNGLMCFIVPADVKLCLNMIGTVIWQDLSTCTITYYFFNFQQKSLIPP